MWKIVIIFVFLSCRLWAQQPNQITVKTTDGNNPTVLIEEIINIEFHHDALLFITSSTAFHIPFDDIDNIVFDMRRTESALPYVNAMNQEELKLMISGNQVTIESKNAIQSLSLVDMSGKVLVNKKIQSAIQATITLPYQGVFVLLVQTNKGYVARKIMC